MFLFLLLISAVLQSVAYGAVDCNSVADPSCQNISSLFKHLEGWAKTPDAANGLPNGVQGGLGGKIITIQMGTGTEEADLLAALKERGPRWIIFKGDGEIVLNKTVTIPSDTTLDGRGAHVTIRVKVKMQSGAEVAGGWSAIDRTVCDYTHGTRGPAGVTLLHQIQSGACPDPYSAFSIRSASNIIITNLTFEGDWPDWFKDSEGSDAISAFESSHIWVHHCSFQHWMDGNIDFGSGAPHGIDMGSNPSKYVSATWNRFTENFQAMNWKGDFMSAGHNSCLRVQRRCIQIIGGHAHSYNNVIRAWGDLAVQHSEWGGHLLSQYNIFIPESVLPGWPVAYTVDHFTGGGAIKNVKNMTLMPDGSLPQSSADEAVFLPGLDQMDPAMNKNYANIRACKTGKLDCLIRLRTKIETRAGAQ